MMQRERVGGAPVEQVQFHAHVQEEIARRIHRAQLAGREQAGIHQRRQAAAQHGVPMRREIHRPKDVVIVAQRARTAFHVRLLQENRRPGFFHARRGVLDAPLEILALAAANADALKALLEAPK